MDELDADRYFDYDSLSRLLTARLTDTQNWTAGSEVTTSFQYDDLGNRESHSYRDAGAIAYSHDKANRMSTYAGNTQGYDDAGNLTLAYSADRATSYKYTYDHNNRLIGIYDSGGSTQSAAFTYDALGRRIEFIDDKLSSTTRYYYDGVNEIVETDESANNRRSYVHGISYVDERVMMKDFGDPMGGAGDDRPYYYVIDRMYNVRAIVDRAGGDLPFTRGNSLVSRVVERYCYDPYGRPLIRESAGRGDMDNDTDMDGTDSSRVTDAKDGNIWDPRADLDDDGDVDRTDANAYLTKDDNWPPQSTATVVAQAFSDVGNPFMFQGRPHFALDTAATATSGQLMLNDHRARMNDPVTGRWVTRDPLEYNLSSLECDAKSMLSGRLRQRVTWKETLIHWRRAARTYEFIQSVPIKRRDPSGLCTIGAGITVTYPGSGCGWFWLKTERCQDCYRCQFSFGPPPTTVWNIVQTDCVCPPCRLPPCPPPNKLSWGCNRWMGAPCNISFCRDCCGDMFSGALGGSPIFKNLDACYTVCDNLPGCH